MVCLLIASSMGVVEECVVRRRELLFGASFAAVALPAVNSVALADENGGYFH